MLVLRNMCAVTVAFLCLPLVMALGVLSAPMLAVSFLTRRLTKWSQPTYSSWSEILEFEPRLGWKTKADLQSKYLAVDQEVCHVQTDDHGCFGRSTITDCDVVVFGDSFAFGYGVDSEDAYFHVNPHLAVKAIGSPGYSMVQEVMLMREWGPSLSGKVVVWFICLENDLYDNLRPESQHPQHVYPRPFVRKTNTSREWEIVTDHVERLQSGYQPPLRTYYAETFSQCCVSNPFSERIFSAAKLLLQEGSEICLRAGARLHVVTIPHKHQLSEYGVKSLQAKLPRGQEGFHVDFPDQRFDQMCFDLGIPCYSGKKYLDVQDYKEFDGHWSQRGNKRIAKLLEEIYGASLGDSDSRNSHASLKKDHS